MAAGEGRRLRPLTERWPKPVLPIGGRPVIAILLRELRAAGCRRVTVVTGHLAEQIEALLGDGAGFDLELRYVRQPEPLGSADTVVRSLAAGAQPPFLVSTADTVFAPGDVARFAEASDRWDGAGALAVRREPPPGPDRPGAVVDEGLVLRITDEEGASPLAHASLWALAPALVPFLEGLPGPPYELREAYQRAIDAGERIAAFEIGKTRDLTHPSDLVKENVPYLGSSA